MNERSMHPAKKPAEVRFLKNGKIEIVAVGIFATIEDKPFGKACYEAQRKIAVHSLEIPDVDRERLSDEVRLWRGDGIYLDTTQCRACGSDIRWRTTPAGKNMPLEVTPHMGPARGTYVIVNDHECRPSDPLFDNNERNFMNHWARCPMSDEFRGGTKS